MKKTKLNMEYSVGEKVSLKVVEFSLQIFCGFEKYKTYMVLVSITYVLV